MLNDEKDTYFVAVKVFLEQANQFLILKDGFGQWDIPGGRLKKSEFGTPFDQVVARKMWEELGGDFQYELGQPIVLMRHERVEAVPGSPTVRILGVGYQAGFKGGNIALTSHHVEMLWVNKKTFDPSQYFTGGWLAGVQEYLARSKR